MFLWVLNSCAMHKKESNLVRQMRISFNFVGVAKPQMFGKKTDLKLQTIHHHVVYKDSL